MRCNIASWGMVWPVPKGKKMKQNARMLTCGALSTKEIDLTAEQ